MSRNTPGCVHARCRGQGLRALRRARRRLPPTTGGVLRPPPARDFAKLHFLELEEAG